MAREPTTPRVRTVYFWIGVLLVLIGLVEIALHATAIAQGHRVGAEIFLLVLGVLQAAGGVVMMIAARSIPRA